MIKVIIIIRCKAKFSKHLKYITHNVKIHVYILCIKFLLKECTFKYIFIPVHNCIVIINKTYLSNFISMLYNKRVKLQVVKSVISFVWYQICRDPSFTFIFFHLHHEKHTAN